MKTTLKPCPFCGSKARNVGGQVDDTEISAIRCSNSDCLASFRAVDRDVWNSRIGAVAGAFDEQQERLLFEAAGAALHGWGQGDYVREAKGCQEYGDYMWLEQRRAFALWLAARSMTVTHQPPSRPVPRVRGKHESKP